MIRSLFCSALAASLGLAVAAASAATTLTVNAAWSRPATDTGAAYFTIVNGGTSADRLLEVKSPVAAHVEIHETVQGASGDAGMPGMSGMAGMSAMHGMVTMKRVNAVAVPAGGGVRFKPGSYHVMLIGLKHPLKAGDVVPLRLRFEKAGTIDVNAPVRATAPN
jgi:hypothetical protein